jgi:hypothetical protein
MTLKIEVVVDGRMDIEEALGGSSRFKALHLALSSSYYLVRIFGPIVLPESLLMAARQLYECLLSCSLRSTSSRLKLAAFWRCGYSLNVCRNSPI